MEEIYNAIAYGLAIILALAIVLIPIALAVLFTIWLFKKIFKPRHRATKQTTERSEPGTYQTGWKWNEDTQLWELPTQQHKAEVQKQAIRQETIPHKDAEADAKTPDRYVMPNPGKVQGYKAKLLLTKNEWHEHKKLREYAAKKGLYVCPKVRLIDLVTPYGNGKEYMTRFHKVQAKHVDFVLVDEAMHIRAIVELDDSSHDNQERQERDQFVDDVLSSTGYTIIHTRCVTEQTLSRL